MNTPTKPDQKLRASCDGCYLAKLKCTKEKPTCPRCRNLGLTCHYSPSQRAGKTRARQHSSQSSQASQISQSPQVCQSPQLCQTSQAPQVLQASEWTLDALSNAQSMVTTEPLAESTVPTTLQANNAFQPLWPDLPPSGPPGSATTLPDLDDDLLARWQDFLPTPRNEAHLFKLPDVLIDDIAPPPPDPEILPAIKPPSSDHRKPRICHCFPSLVQALQTIQAQATSPNTTALDTVLSNSKDMISHGETMLHCTCSEDSSLVMLFAGLMAKHLSFYGPAATTSPPPFALSADTTTPMSSNVTSRVTIGNYTVDGEDEERLRTEITLMELQKLNTLLLKFRSKCSTLPVGSESHMYETVVNFLHTRLRETTARLQLRKLGVKGEA